MLLHRVIMIVMKRKDGWIINDHKLHLDYTPEMEKAMQQSHGLGYQEYSRQLNKRMQVEREREMDYKKGQFVRLDMEHSVYK